MAYQWYPGHMTKAVRNMQEDIKLIDLIIEIVDARIPLSSRNPDINKISANKPRVIVMNKSDLSDPVVNKKWIDEFEKKGYFVVEADARNTSFINRLNDIVKKSCKDKIERDLKRGIKNRPIRAMVVGIPNVGKSTFINSFAGKSCVKTGNKPGVTKGKQWIRLNKSLELLDTPGILWPKFETEQIGINLALIGSINDDIVDTTELSILAVDFLCENYKDKLLDRYKIIINDEDKSYDILNKIAIERNCIKKGNEADIERVSQILIDEFRSGKIGRLSLEKP